MISINRMDRLLRTGEMVEVATEAIREKISPEAIVQTLQDMYGLSHDLAATIVDDCMRIEKSKHYKGAGRLLKLKRSMPHIMSYATKKTKHTKH